MIETLLPWALLLLVLLGIWLISWAVASVVRQQVASLRVTAAIAATTIVAAMVCGGLGYKLGWRLDPYPISPHGSGWIRSIITLAAVMMGGGLGLVAGLLLTGSRPGVLRKKWKPKRRRLPARVHIELSDDLPAATNAAGVSRPTPAPTIESLSSVLLSPGALSSEAQGSTSMLAQLVVVSGPDKGRLFSLEDGQTLQIGRGQEAQTQLTDPRISRKQCALQVDGGKFVLLDAGSSAGTFVNGEKVARHQLQPGDILRIGDTELRLQLDARADQSTLAPADSGPAPHVGQATPLEKLVGQTLQHFEIQKVLATGNTGMVFKGLDTHRNRPSAIKVLWPESSKREEEVQRFVRAMKTMINVQHENLVQIYAAGKTGAYCWVAMEYVDGESLSKVIDRIGAQGMLDWRNSLRVAVHVGRALEKAHEEQIIHRNITPENILVRHADKVTKLGDLMLAKALEGALARPVTRQGQLVGDVVYMPPERTRSDAQIDCRADIYSLGATCYALLTGRPPFEGHSLPEVVAKIRRGGPPRPKQFQMAINDKFEDCVMKMLAVRPEDRYETSRHLLIDLDRIARFESVAV